MSTEIKDFLKSKTGPRGSVVTAGTESDRKLYADWCNKTTGTELFSGDTFEEERRRTYTSVEHGGDVVCAFGASTCHIDNISVVYSKDPTAEELEAFEKDVEEKTRTGIIVAAGLPAVVTNFSEYQRWEVVTADSFNTAKLSSKAALALDYIEIFKKTLGCRMVRVGNRKFEESYVTDALPEGVGKVSGGDIKTIEKILGIPNGHLITLITQGDI